MTITVGANHPPQFTDASPLQDIAKLCGYLPLALRAAGSLLADTPDLVTAAEAGSGEQLLEKLGTGRFDCVLLDLSMPGMHGLEALQRIKEQHPGLPVLVMSIHPEDQFARRALKAGASGYLPRL